MNRAQRRKAYTKFANDVVKGREKALAKQQKGIGFVLTNLVFAITFYKWTWVLMDRR